MKTTLIAATLLTLGACAQVAMVCDREAQTYDKFGTTEDACAVVTVHYAPRVSDDGNDRPHPPTEPPEQPKPKVHLNNGFGNGNQDAPGKSEFHNNAENAGGNN